MFLTYLKAALMILIPGMIVAWLSYDFYHTIVNGVTYKLRVNGTLDFSEYPFIFIFTVVLKLVFYVFMLSFIRDGFRVFKSYGKDQAKK
ncbi:hypothetical protein OO007_15085 [Cocleimonas sp. KMM 6892]|uniref:hypothetical protein n=1 Tax=unclassified Cocleimonas TaxID=2639732 RepID=UPI002DBCEE14|nr:MULTISPECIES: hypothetical protein [unclassified Cocleimonas]MEB8433563.1 hypothetical protein [Cocleimonas sp. KMM 6892]MEC4716374.1 hypothetical protein [Cocleimonas sp. KMM 6895]MEC4745733.1 hypothetical protein [Cocleimonas sp. KMM 6896]